MKATEYRSPTTLNDYELGWLAGFVDGEGTFILRFKPNQAGDLHILDMSIQVTSTDYDLIETLESLVGGRTYGPRLKQGCKPCWSWRIYRRHDVYDFCLALRPHLCARRQERVTELINAYETYARKE